jgi:hypothetical protein
VSHESRVVLVEFAVETSEHVDPDLDVLTLRLAHLAFGRGGQVPQVAVLDADEV